MSKKKGCRCKCSCSCKCKKENSCKVKATRNSCAGFDACKTLPTLLLLCQSGLLNNDRAYTLFLLFWLCGGVNADSCGYRCC